MSNSSYYKKLLSSSTTMPYGTAQSSSSLLTGTHLRPSHAHGAGCSCCGPADDGDEYDQDEE